MKSCQLLILATVAILSSPVCVSADPAADAAWQKVDDAMKAIKTPATPPKSRQEAEEFFKAAVPVFETAMKEFASAAPKDVRIWSAKLFDAQLWQARQLYDKSSAVDPRKALDEITAATDADAQTKGTAGGLKLLLDAKDLESSKGPSDEWVKATEAHLKTYVEGQYHRQLGSKLKSIRATAELKDKPLDLKFTALDGTEIDLAKMRGKVVLIDFWAVWCGPCVAEIPNVVKAYEKLHPKGFEIIGISLDSDKAKLEAFIKDKKMTWPQYYDGKSWQNEISSRYGINSIPAMWLIDKKGMLVSTNVRGRLEEEVEKRLAE